VVSEIRCVKNISTKLFDVDSSSVRAPSILGIFMHLTNTLSKCEISEIPNFVRELAMEVIWKKVDPWTDDLVRF
jgi:hypothetical protein